MTRVLTIVAALLMAAIAAGGAPGAQQKQAFPEVIQLAAGIPARRNRSGEGHHLLRRLRRERGRSTGAICARGRAQSSFPGTTGKAATGIELDNRNRLWVAGAGTGKAYVYDARTGAPIRTYTFASTDTFINDVVVTRTAAIFTDSRKAVLYHVPIGPGGALGAAHTIPVTGDFVLGERLQPQRNRCDPQWQDTDRGPVEQRQALPHRSGIGSRAGRSRSVARAFRMATGSCSRGRRSTSSRTN